MLRKPSPWDQLQKWTLWMVHRKMCKNGKISSNVTFVLFLFQAHVDGQLTMEVIFIAKITNCHVFLGQTTLCSNSLDRLDFTKFPGQQYYNTGQRTENLEIMFWFLWLLPWCLIPLTFTGRITTPPHSVISKLHLGNLVYKWYLGNRILCNYSFL